MKNIPQEMPMGEAIDVIVGVVDQLVEHHLTLEQTPIPFKERVIILYETLPEDFNPDDIKLIMSVAVALLVAEREKTKELLHRMRAAVDKSKGNK